MNQLLGVVMCGGKSQRMGTDKGLIPIGNTCWAAFVGQKFDAANLPFCISINSTQFKAYQTHFSREQLVLDSATVGGPLNGLLSVHQQYPDNDLFLLACDMIDTNSKTIDRLIHTYTNEPEYDHYAYQHDGFFEPFCAIYTSRGLKRVFEGQDISAQPNTSLKKVLTQGTTRHIEIFDPQSFNNYNTPDL